ncbi:hypothetical protein D9613_012777 [Agrocybe pediades]|uniref:Uncharacterized protein n=1 Tax=Agrocybe pediades TaxID=84607 RepID=A0A8H4QKF9_9AGAR|nr:hypothetical protein D9613_012777 [Agrocybe pediades]
MGHQWTTKPQHEWLSHHIPNYLEKHASGRTQLNPFLEEVQRNWFKEFPDIVKPDGTVVTISSPGYGDAVEGRKKQIDDWFDWHAVKKHRRAKGKQLAQEFLKIAQAESQKVKSTRRPHEAEKFRELFPDEVTAALDAKYSQAQQASFGKQKVNKLREVATECFKTATKSQKQAVAKSIAAWQVQQDEAKKQFVQMIDKDDEEISRTPEELQRCIDDFPDLVEYIIEIWAKATGWSIMVLAGGPKPSAGGRVVVSHHHDGPTNVNGQDFRKGYPDFDGQLMKNWSRHVLSCFPQELRDKRALIPASTTGEVQVSENMLDNPKLFHFNDATPGDANHHNPDQASTVQPNGNSITGDDTDESGQIQVGQQSPITDNPFPPSTGNSPAPRTPSSFGSHGLAPIGTGSQTHESDSVPRHPTPEISVDIARPRTPVPSPEEELRRRRAIGGPSSPVEHAWARMALSRGENAPSRATMEPLPHQFDIANLDPVLLGNSGVAGAAHSLTLGRGPSIVQHVNLNTTGPAHPASSASTLPTSTDELNSHLLVGQPVNSNPTHAGAYDFSKDTHMFADNMDSVVNGAPTLDSGPLDKSPSNLDTATLPMKPTVKGLGRKKSESLQGQSTPRVTRSSTRSTTSSVAPQVPQTASSIGESSKKRSAAEGENTGKKKPRTRPGWKGWAEIDEPLPEGEQ